MYQGMVGLSFWIWVNLQKCIKYLMTENTNIWTFGMKGTMSFPPTHELTLKDLEIK